MKFTISFLMLVLASGICFSQPKTLYDFKAKTIDGKELDFLQFKGKKVMIVNTASECSLTPQYKRLQKLYKEYGGENFTIVAFPSNDFFNHEPGSNKDIKEFYTAKYGVTFPLMEKISVKGKNNHLIYKWLTSSAENGKLDARVRRNFQKFLIDKNGNVEDFIPPFTRPDVKRVIKWILSD